MICLLTPRIYLDMLTTVSSVCVCVRACVRVCVCGVCEGGRVSGWVGVSVRVGGGGGDDCLIRDPIYTMYLYLTTCLNHFLMDLSVPYLRTCIFSSRLLHQSLIS